MTDDASDDGKWLTYQQLAEIRRISKPSAIRLVMRHRWRRQRDNERVVRVLVPADMLEPDRPSSDASDDASYDTSDDTSSVAAGALAVLEDAVSALREQLEQANGRAERAEQAAADERARIDRLVQEFGEARREADVVARAALDEAQQRADTLHQGLAAAEGLATSLRAELDAARQDAADAQAAVDAARITQSEVEAEAAMARTDLETARGLDAERRGQGRWARLRAAWRGE